MLVLVCQYRKGVQYFIGIIVLAIIRHEIYQLSLRLVEMLLAIWVFDYQSRNQTFDERINEIIL